MYQEQASCSSEQGEAVEGSPALTDESGSVHLFTNQRTDSPQPATRESVVVSTPALAVLADQLQYDSVLKTLQDLRTFLDSHDNYEDIFFSHHSEALDYLDKMLELAQHGQWSCNRKSHMVCKRAIAVLILQL